MNKEGYIPKDQRKKILFIGDDIRFPTGVGNIMKSTVIGTAHQFNYVVMGAGAKHPEDGKRFDLSQETNQHAGITDSSVILYPSKAYDNVELIRYLIQYEKPDVILFITDPRYYIRLFAMEHEIRTKGIKMIYLTIWDAPPAPFYNKAFYQSCDALLCISQQTKALVETVLGEEAKDKVIRYVPHGVNPEHFYPIEDDDIKLQQFRKAILDGKEYDFVLLFNSRNIRRKQISDTLLAFKLFLNDLRPEQADKCAFILHTQPVDENGTDLYAVRELLFGDKQDQIIFSDRHADLEYMNLLYNVADCTILLSSNEGWGLSITESLMAGTPVIGNVTGGIQDQARFEDRNGDRVELHPGLPSNNKRYWEECGDWFLPVFPSIISIQGSPATPYITDDRCDPQEAAWEIKAAYTYSTFTVWGKDDEDLSLPTRGLNGRKWLLSDEAKMSAAAMCQNITDAINDTLLLPNKEKYEIIKVEERPLKYLPNVLNY